MGYITWPELTFAVGFILGCVLCIYLIILIKNFSDSLRLLKNLFQANKDNIDETLKNMPVISKNLVEISNSAKTELKAMESAISNFNETAEATAATAQTIKNDIVGKVKNIVELVDLARRVFLKDKEPEKTGRASE